MKEKKSLFMQDNPGNSQIPRKSQHHKRSWQKQLFKLLFKGIEILWMLVQIFQVLSEAFKQ